jgi:hypothetical protein
MTSTKQRLDWTEGYRAEANSADGPRWLAVADEMTTFEAALPDGMTVAEALADYALGYHTEPAGREVEVGWRLYQGGEETDQGYHRLVSR